MDGRQAATIVLVLKALGYETSQLGTNYLGDLNEYLPACTASTSSSAES